MRGGVAGDNLGNHTALQNLDLSAFELVGNGGTSGISISSSGNIGIGTTDPKEQFHIRGSEGGILLEETIGGDDNEAYLVHHNNFFQIQNRTSDGTFVQTPVSISILAPSNTIRAVSNGNVGLGIADPLFPLDVDGIVNAKALRFVDESDAHINVDGALYRIGGQAFLTVDDNFYIRDNSGGSPFRFETENQFFSVDGNIHMKGNGWKYLMMDGDASTKTFGLHYGGDSSNEVRFGRLSDNFGGWEATVVRFDLDAPGHSLVLNESGTLTATAFVGDGSGLTNLPNGVVAPPTCNGANNALQWDGSNWVCATISGGGGGGGTVALIGGTHDSDDCVAEGGSAYEIAAGWICKIPTSTCPSGWSQHDNWSTTGSKSCSGSGPCPASCTTGFHAFSDNAVETCVYLSSSAPGSPPLYQCKKVGPNATCTSTVSEVGCI